MNTFSTDFISPNAWVYRNGFGLITPLMVWFVMAFILFQIVGGLVGFGVYLAFETVDFSDPMALMNGINEHPIYLLTGNTVGQFAVIGFLSWLITSIFSDGQSRSGFVRMNSRPIQEWMPFTIISLVLLVTAYPFLMGVQYVNAFMPQPEFLLEMEKASVQILEKFFMGDTPSWVIFLHVALTPAICEEVMFRGLILRVFDKKMGTTAAIIVSGLLFGFYHVRLTQVLVLSLIGMLLAWITIKSDSLWPAIILHATNNGLLSLAPRLFPDFTAKYLDTETVMLPPFWLLALSLVLSLSMAYILWRKKRLNPLLPSPKLAHVPGT